MELRKENQLFKFRVARVALPWELTRKINKEGYHAFIVVCKGSKILGKLVRRKAFKTADPYNEFNDKYDIFEET